MKIVGAGGPCEAIATKRTNARRRSETWVQYSTASDKQKTLGETCAVSPHGLPALDCTCTAIHTPRLLISCFRLSRNLGGMWGRGTAVGDARKCS
jgi:hypothetical protein